MEKKSNRTKKVIGMVICLSLILISWFPMNRTVSDPKTYQNTIKALEKKTTNVMALTTVTTATSVAITALPEDTGTTLAEHLMDLNSGLMVVLIALFLEKYLLIIIGKVVFLAIIPLGLVIMMIGIGKNNKYFILKSVNVMLAGILLFATIPTGVGVSNEIEKVYQFSLEDVVQSGEKAQAAAEDATDETEIMEETEETKAGNILTDTWSKVTDTVSGAVTGAIDTVSSTITGALEQGKELLKKLTEALAILIVTSCVIPVLIVLVFLWLIKMLTGLDFSDKFLSLHSSISSVQKKALQKTKIDKNIA